MPKKKSKYVMNANILVEAKKEYTSQLVNILSPRIYEGIESIYTDSKNSKDIDNNLTCFQNYLKSVPRWSQTIIDREFKRIERKSDCSWLDKLLTAVFISHTKVLSSVGNNKKKMELHVPNIDHFVHKCYIDAAREFWKSPYLLSDELTPIDRQKNLRESIDIIKKSVGETVRRMLPVKMILQHYLGENLDDDLMSDDVDSFSEDGNSKKERKLLHRVIQKDLEGYIRSSDDSDTSDNENNKEDKDIFTGGERLNDTEFSETENLLTLTTDNIEKHLNGSDDILDIGGSVSENDEANNKEKSVHEAGSSHSVHENERESSVNNNERDTSVNENERDTSVHENERDTSVHENERDTSVHENERDTSVHENERDTSVHENERDTSVHENERDTSVHENERDTSVHDNERDTSVHDNERDTSVREAGSSHSVHEDERDTSVHEDERDTSVREAGSSHSVHEDVSRSSS